MPRFLLALRSHVVLLAGCSRWTRWLLGIATLAAAGSARANEAYYPLSSGDFLQTWSSPGLITANDDWSGVPSIVGYLGQDIITTTAADPRLVIATSAVANDVDVIANQANPNTATAGGVAEFDSLPNPTIALQGSGTADAPHLILFLDTRGRRTITVSYNLRDIDGSTDNAVQPVALQYRIGDAGNFIHLPLGYVADATTGPSLADLVTPVSVVLPPDAENQPKVQVRILTTNAAGNDEWVGVDDLRVTSQSTGGPGVRVALTGGTTVVAEGGVTDTYSLELATAPAGPVTIRVQADAQLEISTDGIQFFPSRDVMFTSLTPQTITVRAIDDAAFEETHSGIVTHTIVATADAANYPLTVAIDPVVVAIADNDLPAAVTRISVIQGSGAASTLVGQTVKVSAVVTGFTTGSSGSRDGFFLQEEDADADQDPATSEGIFVFTAQTPALASTVAALTSGQRVTVVAKVAEFNGLTELTTEGAGVTGVIVEGPAALPTPATVVFPAASATAFERYEGMRVQILQPLTVTGTESLGQFGEVVLSSGGALLTPTSTLDPNDPVASGTSSSGTSNVAAVQARIAADTLRTIVLDDGSSRSFPDPTPFLTSSDPATATRRIGDTVAAFQGVLSYGFGSYRLIATEPVVFTASNPREAIPPAVGGGLKVASFNVLNYFVTFGGAEDRGADSAAEFARQKAKIVAALKAIDADIVGLIEIQNRGVGVTHQTALEDLVAALNTAMGAPGTYAIVPAPLAGTGTDFIRVAMIYKPARVSRVGDVYTDPSVVFQRPPLAQAFKPAGGSGAVIVCVNHFKSKGSGSGADADQGDGQGASNASRKEQAYRLVSFLESVKSAVGDQDVLIIGDLNAYAEEDPIDILRAAGYVDLIQRFVPAPRYSYSFDNQLGYLDHALASASLNAQVAGAAEWHINSVEPAFLDYNLELNPNNASAGTKSASQQAVNAGTPFRSSDHDPLLVGLDVSALGGTEAPVIVTQPASQTLVIGRPATFTVTATGTPAPAYQWRRNGVDLPGATGASYHLPRVTSGAVGVYTVVVTNPAGSVTSASAVATVVSEADAPFRIVSSPTSVRVSLGGSATFSVVVEGTATPAYQWYRDGWPLPGRTGSTVTLSSVGVADLGLYSVSVSAGGATQMSEPALLGALSTAKVAGGGREVAADVRHPNGNLYDQVLLTGPAAALTADPGQITRVSFVDLSDDIVQVEFSGAGVLAVVLEGASGPALPSIYVQDVTYLRGRARISLSGADETTHVSLFSVGRANAVNQALFRDDVTYDGVADVASLALSGESIGGVRVANVNFAADRGITGVWARGVTVVGPLYVGEVTAFDAATPALFTRSAADARITGGDLAQANGRFVQIGGLNKLYFVAGTTSQGVVLPAKASQGRLEDNGVEVTDRVVVNPAP